MKILALFFSILIAEAVGIVGSLFTVTGMNSWYDMLSKPEWNPPSWVFGPVWTTLYALMGVAAYRVWTKREHPGAIFALWIYGIHLIFNTLWSILFFGLQSPGWALIEILVLLALIIATMILFYRVDRASMWLLVPYLMWVMFATALTFSIWRLNG